MSSTLTRHANPYRVHVLYNHLGHCLSGGNPMESPWRQSCLCFESSTLSTAASVLCFTHQPSSSASPHAVSRTGNASFRPPKTTACLALARLIHATRTSCTHSNVQLVPSPLSDCPLGLPVRKHTAVFPSRRQQEPSERPMASPWPANTPPSQGRGLKSSNRLVPNAQMRRHKRPACETRSSRLLSNESTARSSMHAHTHHTYIHHAYILSLPSLLNPRLSVKRPKIAESSAMHTSIS